MSTSTTDFETIREKMISVIEGLTPRKRSQTKFQVVRGKFDWLEWVETHGRTRQFSIFDESENEEPEQSDELVESTRADIRISIVYPQRESAWGPDGTSDLEDAIRDDMRLIDKNIGRRGFDLGNYVAGQNSTTKISMTQLDLENVILGELLFEAHYYRDATK